MLTFEEVKQYLEVEQEELEKYIQQGKLHAYKIGGVYLRFRKEEVLNVRHQIRPRRKTAKPKNTFFSRIADFWHFNNFYIISLLIIVLLTVFVIQE